MTSQGYRGVILGVVLALSAVALARATTSEPVVLRTPLEEFPMNLSGWAGTRDPALEPQILAVLGVDEYLSRTYRSAGAAPLGLYIGYYKTQREGQSIHSPLNCLPGSGWQPVSTGRTVLNEAQPPAEINRYVIEKAGVTQLVLYWYQSHGRVVASEYWGKFYLIADAIRMNRTDAALVRVIVPIGARPDGEAAAERTGMAFVHSMFPLLSRHLPL